MKFGITLGYQNEVCSICKKRKNVRIICNKNKKVNICDECMEKNKTVTIEEIVDKYGEKIT